LGVYEAMRNPCDAGFEITLGCIFDKAVSHPGEIGASFEFLVAAIEEAIVSLIEDFVPLVEVNYFIIKLRQIEVIFLKCNRLVQMSLVDGLTHEVELGSREVLECGWVLLMSLIV
jgi:hypothetical protein